MIWLLLIRVRFQSFLFGKPLPTESTFDCLPANHLGTERAPSSLVGIQDLLFLCSLIWRYDQSQDQPDRAEKEP